MARLVCVRHATDSQWYWELLNQLGEQRERVHSILQMARQLSSQEERRIRDINYLLEEIQHRSWIVCWVDCCNLVKLLVSNGKEHEYWQLSKYVPGCSSKNTWMVNRIVKFWKIPWMQLIANAPSQFLYICRFLIPAVTSIGFHA